MTAVIGSSAVGLCLDPQFSSPTGCLTRARAAEEAGADSVWLAQLPNQRDSLSVLGLLAATTSRIRLGCGIVPLYSRPPVVTAQTILTLDEISAGRVELGLGLGARAIGEWSVGASVHPPLPAMAEYTAVVTDLIRTGEVSRTGKHYSGHASYQGPRRSDLPVLIGAFGPKLIRLAARIADGLVLFMTTPDYVASVVMPAVRAGLADRAEPAPFRVLAMTALGLSSDPERDREIYRGIVAMHLRVPSYRTQYERLGHGDSVASGRVSDRLLDALFLTGDADQVGARAGEFAAAGVDEVLLVPPASAHDDLQLLGSTVTAARGLVPVP